MRILVTGAGGFIGSHLTECLLAAGHEVRALVRYTSSGSAGHLAEVSPRPRSGLDIQLGDVTDPFLMRGLVSGCDAVLHLAALIGIPYSYVAPASYIATNVNGTLNLLEACREAHVPRIVVTSTSEVYGTALFTPMTEDHPLQGQSPYSASKIAADKLVESYVRSFDLPAVTLRPFNTYGPRQSTRAVIPTILTQALSGSEKIELGSLTPKRDLTFVGDTARAFLLAATAPGVEGETIHFGQGKAVSVGELVDICLAASGSRAKVVATSERQRPEKSEVGLLLCDAGKAKKLLDWTPTVTLAEGIGRTVEWLRAHPEAMRRQGYAV